MLVSKELFISFFFFFLILRIKYIFYTLRLLM
ncbi:hypothetical protein PFUGPA_03195 [Plasmodium falciparum Palo Alto/Uganda]|uniref:Uncharacterized protein n=1 Tax=Plasmodium falciparum (isolate Palo Alto / Uganda) TaxID=57270 RepID=W4IYZ5_PLAFP|nr:hypothetical protein PFUGPA_03195 [Plasmodium falciparum Palo Alto/Uganda]